MRKNLGYRKLTGYDAEKLCRMLLMEWYGVSGNCIDYKLKTSRPTRHRQDIFGVFDAILNDNNNKTLGFQFKYLSRAMTGRRLYEWSKDVLMTNFNPENAFIVIINKQTNGINVYCAKDCLKFNT